MMYTVEFLLDLENSKIPKYDLQRIRDKIAKLSHDPRPRWSEKLKTRSDYRIPIGDYRAIYSIDDERRSILIKDIGNRKEIYRQ